MLLRNWINYCNFKIRNNSGYYLVLKNTRYQTYTGTSWSFAYSATCNQYSDVTGEPSCSRIGIVLGSDTQTELNIDNIKIYAPITTLTSTGVSNNIDSSNSSWEAQSVIELSQTVKNDTSDDITVTELGIFANGSDTGATFVFTRDVISPVVIAPTETKTFIIRIDLAEMATAVSVS